MGNTAGTARIRNTIDMEHPDVIKAQMDAIHADIRQRKEIRLRLLSDFEARQQEYIEYIGEDRLEEVLIDNVWILAIEPTFTRIYIRSKESKALRDMASAWKRIHDCDDYLLQRERDLEELNSRLARSLSLKSTHGLLRETMRERDAAADERELMRLELESALALAKTNIMKRLNDSPSIIIRFKEWNLKHFLPGPDPRNREKGCQERTVSALIVEPSSSIAFFEVLRDLTAHKGLNNQYGFSLTKKNMLIAEWGFIDPMPFHGQHYFQGRKEQIYEDIDEVKPDESILLGFHYNRFRTTVSHTGPFKLPETQFDHFSDRKEFEDILGFMAKIYEIPGMIAQLYTEKSTTPAVYCVKIVRISI